jgi:hypothetical protein
VLQRRDIAEENYRRFVERAARVGQVWGLKSDDEKWVVSDSNEDEDRKVMPFWSDAAYARRCAKGPWSEFKPTPIPLDKFLEKWLPGLDQRGHFVGANWDGNASGVEVYPLSLKQKLEEALQRPPS